MIVCIASDILIIVTKQDNDFQFFFRILIMLTKTPYFFLSLYEIQLEHNSTVYILIMMQIYISLDNAIYESSPIKATKIMRYY